VALIIAILVFGRSSEDDSPSPVARVAPATASSANLSPDAQGAPAPDESADNWQQTAEALGAVERHLNRAQLVFDEIAQPSEQPLQRAGEQDGETRKAGEADGSNRAWGRRAPGERVMPERRKKQAPKPGSMKPAQGSAPEEGSLLAGEAFAQGANGGSPPDPSHAPPPPPVVDAQMVSRTMWEMWKQDWTRDLDVAEAMLVPNERVSAQLRPGHDAIRTLLEACRKVPPGEPPGEDERRSWLTSLKLQAEAARETLYRSR
jgi:hypothetical protein